MTPGCDPHAAAEMLRALAHPMRLAILCRLLDGEAAVSAFENELGLRQPSLSQQLSYLREAGLVATQKVSKTVIYRLTDPRVRPIIETVRATFSADGNTQTRPAPPWPTEHKAPTMPRAICPAGRKPVIAGCGVFSSAGWPRT
jgi:DNA-binding transcriptional ArsR family regulator